MTTITTRSGKGSPLTNAEVDANFTNLNNDKSETTHNHSGVYEPVITKNTGFNKNLGTTAGTVSEGDHNHDADYSAAGHNHDTTYVNITGDTMTGDLTAPSFVGDLQGALTDECKNVTAGTLAKGTPVYQSGAAGHDLEVQAADASSSATMPAIGVVGEDITAGSTGKIIFFGFIQGVDTSTFSEGDTIYVASGGGYTNTPPTGEGNLLQNLGKVLKVHATNGGGVVMGAGRSNATPNLNNGNVFIGNASNQSEARALQIADTTGLQTALDGKTNETYVDTAVANLVDSAPATLDTLNELAAALGDDPNFATTVTNSIATKANSTDVYTKTELNNGQLDTRYYTETETNTLLSGKANTTHTHPINDVTNLQAELDAANNNAVAMAIALG